MEEEICIRLETYLENNDQRFATSHEGQMNNDDDIEELEESISEELANCTEESGESISEELANCIRKELGMLKPLSDQCCIYRIPERTRNLYPRLYIPQELSIGPYHHGKEELKEMEEHKRRYLVEFLKWTNQSIEDLIIYIEKRERRLRNCYAETFELDREAFVKTVLVDATFIIALFVKSRFSRLRRSNDRIFNKPLMLRYIRYDLMLLENQIPYFILEDLFKLSNLGDLVANGMSMVELTHSFFKGRCGSWVTQNILKQQDFSNVQHLLDFLRTCQQPHKLKPKTKLKSLVLPTITELHNAGVKFELHPSEYKVDIEFDKGILRIPYFNINQETETLLKNLQKFEDCHCGPSEKYVNDYICMISLLVRDSKDVELLDQNGIIENWLGSNQVVANRLSTNIKWTYHRDNFYFTDTVEDLNGYCKDP